MRKVNKLGRRAAAMALAIGLTLSTVPPVLAVDADEVEAPAAQTEQQEVEEEPAASEEEQPTEEPASSEEEQPTEEPAASEEEQPVEEPAASEEEQPTEEPASSEEEQPEEEPAKSGDVDTYGLFHDCTYDELIEQKDPTCTEGGYKTYQCTHVTTIGKKNIRCTNTHTDEYPALDHKFTDYKVTKAATEGEDGEQVATCDYGCGTKKKQTIHYYGEWEVIKEATCYAKGEKKRTCLNCGHVETVEIKTIPHTFGKYVNDNKPACEQQTETAHCTVEGCTATDTQDLPNLGANNTTLPHKFTHYEGYYKTETIKNIITGEEKEVTYLAGYISTCDYCHSETNTVSVADGDALKDIGTGAATDTALKNVNLDGKTADEYVDAIINKALANAQEAVKKAKTKEEAVDALDQISSTVKAELSKVKITVAGVGGDVQISEADLNSALKPLDDTIADLKSSLNDSFLSQKTITNVVDKLAGDVEKSDAPKTGIRQILYNTVYDTIYNIGVSEDKKKTTDNTQAISDMVLQLVQDVVDTSKTGEGYEDNDKKWNALTGSLVDDAVQLAVDELMKDETYAKLLKTKLGKATLKEVEDEIANQLVNDPEFMNQVRKIAENAASNAQERVNGGWPTEKIMDGLQADLLPAVTNLVSDQVSKLGASTGTIVDKKVSDTVHKFLPGKLGDWVSDKIGGAVNGAVTGKVDDLNKQVTDLISTTIRQLTCTHQYDPFTVASTCTQKGQTGEICKKCGKTRNTKDIEELAPHTPVVDAAVAPTETSDGLTEGSHCSVCGAVLTAQEVIPMLDPTIDTWFSRAATTEADAKAAGYDSVEAANAALDAALTAAGFDPANAEHFTVQVNSSIGVLPNDRFPGSGVTGKLTLPEGTRGKTAQTYYVVQMFTADTRFHKAGDVVVTPVSIDNYAKTGLKFTVYTEAIVGIAWKAQ